MNNSKNQSHDNHKQIDRKFPGGSLAVLLLSFAAEFSPLQNTKLSITLFILALLIAITGILITYISKDTINNKQVLVFQLPEKIIFKKDFYKQAAALSGEIIAFVEQREKDAPQWPKSEDVYPSERSIYNDETRSIYNQRYLVRSLALYDLFTERGINVDDDRWDFTNPNNYWSMREVGLKLGLLAAKK